MLFWSSVGAASVPKLLLLLPGLPQAAAALACDFYALCAPGSCALGGGPAVSARAELDIAIAALQRRGPVLVGEVGEGFVGLLDFRVGCDVLGNFVCEVSGEEDLFVLFFRCDRSVVGLSLLWVEGGLLGKVLVTAACCFSVLVLSW